MDSMLKEKGTKEPMWTILVLCDDYPMAKNAYNAWVTFLKDTEPGFIQNYSEANLSVETGRLLRYIFCDYRMESLLEKAANTTMCMLEFFDLEDVSPFYYAL